MADCCTRRPFALAAFVMIAALSAQHAVPADPSFSFLDPRSIDLSRVLPLPPSDTSDVTRAELDAMLMIQERRSAAQGAAALADNEVALDRFSAAVGSAKSLTELPLTMALMRKVDRDVSPFIGAAKDAFNRPRPYALETRLKPVIPLPAGSSYPSGHVVWANVTGLVLAGMVPERRIQILARAEEFSRNRVVAGVHYPSDVECGGTAAAILAAFLFASPDFERERVAAAKELRAALGLPEQAPRPASKS